MSHWILNGRRVPVGKTAKSVEIINEGFSYAKKKYAERDAKLNVQQQKGSDDGI